MLNDAHATPALMLQLGVKRGDMSLPKPERYLGRGLLSSTLSTVHFTPNT
jgi:hypothetical protein